jgi:L-seryl-tRNA(Ser) seleniumtransferase|tara:strand:+ start:16696 stop:18126 length:1431 start_codon:yes stop_codon:yes gene_type:complete
VQNRLLSKVPSVDKILRHEDCQILLDKHGLKLVTAVIRSTLVAIRSTLAEAPSNSDDKSTEVPDMHGVIELVAGRLNSQPDASLLPVFNLTGTVLHTNLGRAPLPPEALEAIITTAAGASNLEFDLASGDRGDRDSHIEALLCDLTGAESATVVNNNAAAVLLVLNTLALNKEVPVSRGELVEIGGSFRVPDIMARAGCKLIEIGTTNRTHRKDYSNAINDSTAILMKVHTSNYAIRGFTTSVTDTELSDIARQHGIPFVTDLGSGTLIDLRDFGLPFEPTVRETIDNGADVVTFSGDKLLGGPQAGIIVGRKRLIDAIKSNPMKRALRVDKMTISALYEVLKLYRDPDRLSERLPTLRLLTRSLEEISAVATRIHAAVVAALGPVAEVSIVDCQSQIGSGSLPLDLLPSRALALRPKAKKGDGLVLDRMSAAFRALPTPVIGRINAGALIFDLRCLQDEDGFVTQLGKLKPVDTP